MSWSDIIEQSHVVEALRRAVDQDRIAHAYLFHGPDGVGKRALAVEFSKALLCLSVGNKPCGTCRNCSRVTRFIHPDVRLLFPYPKDTKHGEIRKRIDLLAGSPYATVDFARRPFLDDPSRTSNKQTIYNIERVHQDLLGPLMLKSVEGGYKVAIVTDIDAMRKEGANAFLKLLEEPPPQTVFILTTSRLDRLLATTISRCQAFRFDFLTDHSIAKRLVDEKLADAGHAEALARIAGGSFGNALDLVSDQGIDELRNLVVHFVRKSYARDGAEIADIASMLYGSGRERTKMFLVMTIGWIRDIVLKSELGDEARLTNVDQSAIIDDFVVHLPGAHLESMASLTEDAIAPVTANARIDLVVIALSHALADAMRGSREGRLVIPLFESVEGHS